MKGEVDIEDIGEASGCGSWSSNNEYDNYNSQRQQRFSGGGEE